MRDIKLNDFDTKGELPIHMILDISDYTRIETPERVRTGLPREPIVELTKLSCYKVYPGKEIERTNVLFSETSMLDYEKL